MDPTPSARSARPFLLPGLIAVASILAFLPSLRGEFLLWDDDANFLLNPHYRGFSAENLRWMFTNSLGHYMPLTWLTLALDYVLWGMDPTGYHATNLALHAVNAVLCFFVLRRLVRKASPDLAAEQVDLPAAAGALLFSVHPLRVESVAWITERRDLLSGVFFLLTILAYLRAADAPDGSAARRRALILTALAFAAMLFSKTMGLTLPVVFLILDVYPLRRCSRASLRGLLIEKIPLFALMLGALAMLMHSAGQGGMSGRDQYPLTQSLARPGYALTFYAAKTILPINLSPLYWFRPQLGLPQMLGWACALGVTALFLMRRRTLPAALPGWLAYGVLIAPATGVVSLGSFYAADHYSYVACLPFAAIATALVVLLLRRTTVALMGTVSAILLLAYAGTSWWYCGVWKDSVALWTRAIRLEPDVYFSHANLGRALAARREWEPAIAEYTRAIELESRWADVYTDRARAGLAVGQSEAAAADATVAIGLDPGGVEGFVVRALACSKLGRRREALADFTRVLEARPNLMEARVGRANERLRVGDLAGALADFDAAIDFDPQPQLIVRRGMARAAQGNLPGAAADFARALSAAPPDWPQRREVEDQLRRVRSEQPR